MELWVAGIALLIIATGILVLILCRKKIHKSLQIAGACVLGVLFVATLGYIALTFLFLDSLDSPPPEEPTVSLTVESEDGEVMDVEGNRCMRGYIYGQKTVEDLADTVNMPKRS